MGPNNATNGSAFSQSVRALPKGARGAAVSAMAKAKAKPEGSDDMDRKLLRKLPITDEHLKAIKKAYGVK